MMKLGLFSLYLLPVAILGVITNIGKPRLGGSMVSLESFSWCSYEALVSYIFVGLIVSSMLTVWYLKQLRQWGEDISVTPKRKDVYKYDYVPTLATLIVFVTMDCSTLRGFVIFCAFMAVIAVAFGKMQVEYCLPTLSLVGFEVCYIYIDGKRVIVVSSEPIKEGEFIYLKRISDGMYFSKRV